MKKGRRNKYKKTDSFTVTVIKNLKAQQQYERIGSLTKKRSERVDLVAEGCEKIT